MKSAVILATLVLCVFSAKNMFPKIATFPRNVRYSYFDPAALPCAYTVYYSMKYTYGGYEMYKVGREMDYGDYISSFQTMEMMGQKVDNYALLRVDMKKEGKPESAAEFQVYGMGTPEVTCSGSYLNDYTQNSVSMIHDILFARLYYTQKTTGVNYNGEICDQYVLNEGGTYGIFYVNKDNRYAGYNFEGMDINMTYSMKSYESDFILPSDATECSSFEKAFQAPEAVPNCPIEKERPLDPSDPSDSSYFSDISISSDSSRNTDTASTTGACATVVLAILMLAVICLF